MGLVESRWQRTVTLCALYFAQGIPWGFMLITLPSYLAYNYRDDFSDAEIGQLKAIILIPWSFKLIWAPIMDSFTIRSMGRRRPWIIGAELMMALTLLGMIGLGNLSEQLRVLLFMYFLHNCFASLQDVCTDALAIDILSANEQGQMNGLMWGSKLVGKLGGASVLSYVINWGGVEACVVVQVVLLLAIMAFPIFCLERRGERRFPWSRSAAASAETSSVRNPLETLAETCRAIALPTLAIYIVFTLTKLIGLGVNEVVTNTLYTQQLGWSDIEFSTASGMYTLIPVVLATFLGGRLADRYGRRRLLCIGFGGFAVAAMSFAAFSERWTDVLVIPLPEFWANVFATPRLEVRWFALSYVLAYETLNAVGSVGFLSLAMRITWSKAAATVFTVYMTLSNVSHVVGNGIAGWVRQIFTDYAESTGLSGHAANMHSYALTFWFVGIITLLPLVLLLRIRIDEVDRVKGKENM